MVMWLRASPKQLLRKSGSQQRLISTSTSGERYLMLSKEEGNSQFPSHCASLVVGKKQVSRSSKYPSEILYEKTLPNNFSRI
jgi:hypothetical protein